MEIRLITIGERPPAWVQGGVAAYAKRMPPHLRLRVQEVRPSRRTKGADVVRLVRQEGERLRAAVPKGALVIALDRAGRALDTEAFAAALRGCMDRGNDLAFLVGGPEGLSAECLAQAHERWSLSRLTFAHPLVRVVVAEQIYRAWSIINNLPYHR